MRREIMAPITQKTFTPMEEQKLVMPKLAQNNGVSSLCIGDYLLSNKEQDKSFLRKYLDDVTAYNNPIKKEIAECSKEIKADKKELNALERMFKDVDNLDEKASLKGQISKLKSEIWNLIRSNCRRAWSLR